MGTKGYSVYRVNGLHFVKYVQYDCYPEGVGDDMVRTSYLEHEKLSTDYARRWNAYRCVEPSGFIGQPSTQCACGSRTCVSAYPIEEEEPLPSYLPPQQDLFIENVFTIDLAKNVFTVNNEAHLAIDKITKDWYTSLDVVDNQQIFDPTCLPAGAVVGIEHECSTVENGVLDQYSKLKTLPLNLSAIPLIPQSQYLQLEFQANAVQTLLRSLKDPFQQILRSWDAKSFPFREWAYLLLSLAIPGQMQLVPVDLFENQLGYSSAVNADGREFFTHEASGVHLRGFPDGSAPPESTYWLGKTLIYLVSCLEDTQLLREGIVNVHRLCVEKAPQTIKHAVLFSIEHFLLVEIDQDGETVRCSRIFRFFELDKHFTVYPSRRNSDCQAGSSSPLTIDRSMRSNKAFFTLAKFIYNSGFNGEQAQSLPPNPRVSTGRRCPLFALPMELINMIIDDPVMDLGSVVNFKCTCKQAFNSVRTSPMGAFHLKPRRITQKSAYDSVHDKAQLSKTKTSTLRANILRQEIISARQHDGHKQKFGPWRVILGDPSKRHRRVILNYIRVYGWEVGKEYEFSFACQVD